MTKKGDSMQAAAALLAPPWRERLPDGQLGPTYGPPSVEAYARHVARWKDWSFRKPSKDALRDADRMIAFVMLEDGTERPGIPLGELQVFRLVYLKGHSSRYAARKLGMSRSSVQTLKRRLRKRMEMWEVGNAER